MFFGSGLQLFFGVYEALVPKDVVAEHPFLIHFREIKQFLSTVMTLVKVSI